jgi:hypothetical protein
MVVTNYDSFLDPRTWPDAEEIEKLRAIYGWKAVEDRSFVAPPRHPLGASNGDAEEASPQGDRNSEVFWHAGKGLEPPTPRFEAREEDEE